MSSGVEVPPPDDQKAIAELCRRGELQYIAKSIARKSGMGPAAADDVSQETVLRVLEKNSAGTIRNIFGLTKSIAKNVMRETWRSEKRAEELPDDIGVFSLRPDQLVEEDELQKKIVIAVHALPIDERMTLASVLYGISQTKLADLRGCSSGEISRRKKEALRKMKTMTLADYRKLPFAILNNQAEGYAQNYMLGFFERHGLGNPAGYTTIPIDESKFGVFMRFFQPARLLKLIFTTRLRPYFSLESECTWSVIIHEPFNFHSGWKEVPWEPGIDDVS
jgi:RNA polymerase sigma factor (sigma-70 family)